MEITASLVKELRERTGAGMMECKKALVETQGDIEAAIENMRQKGLAKADKKADRIAAEGLMVLRLSADQKSGLLLEVNCETDFVARDENFTRFVETIADLALQHQAPTLEDLLNVKMPSGNTIEEERRQLISTIGENILVRRYVHLNTAHKLSGYLHGTRIGALVEYTGNDSETAKDIAMHVVAMQPPFLNREQIPTEALQKEREMFVAQASGSGKPANIIEKMVEGRIQKYVDEITLVGQPFVKDNDKSVQQILDQHQLQISKFIRMAVGEGIEKKTEDFAAEVMAQVRGS